MTQFNEDALKDGKALIAGLEFPYLLQLQTILAAEILSRQASVRQDAKLKIAQLMAEVGLTIDDLDKRSLSRTPKQPVTRAPVPIKYQHPTNPELHWTGRGRMPDWIKQWNSDNGNSDALMKAAA